MTDLSPERAAFLAKTELQMTAKAFDELRRRYLDEIMSAQTPEAAWQAVLALRAANSVAASLNQFVTTGELETHFEENPNG